MATTIETNTPGTSSPNPARLTPEAVIEQVRTLRAQIDDVTPLSKAQRNQIKQRTRKQPTLVVDASIGVIGSFAPSPRGPGRGRRARRSWRRRSPPPATIATRASSRPRAQRAATSPPTVHP